MVFFSSPFGHGWDGSMTTEVSSDRGDFFFSILVCFLERFTCLF